MATDERKRRKRIGVAKAKRMAVKGGSWRQLSRMSSMKAKEKRGSGG